MNMPQRLGKASLGNVIYLTTSGFALLFLVYGVLRLVSRPIDFVAFSAIAVLIWFVGKTARYVLAE